MLSHRTNVILVLTLIVLATGMAIRKSSERAQLTREPETTTTRTAQPVSKKVLEIREVNSAYSIQPERSPARYRDLFLESENYWTYIAIARTAASAGNADAQYYISKALRYCNDQYDRYFKRSGNTLTLDEGLQHAMAQDIPYQVAQLVYDKCHEMAENLKEDPTFESAINWLYKAADAGQPLAQIDKAAILMIQEQNYRDSMTPDTVKATMATSDARPRELLRDAIASLDPAALMSMASIPINANSSDNWVVNSMAWRLVACERGYDCSEQAEWVRETCLFDTDCAPGDSGVDLINKRIAVNDQEVRNRADEINRELDDGAWSELIPDE